MITLALDCSQNKMVVALLQNQKILAHVVQETQNTSDSILQAVQTLVKDTGQTLASITHIVYGNGPGSFTSLRIGLATLWGLFAFTDIKPKIAMVSSLELRLLSLDASASSPIIVFPARLKKVYAGWASSPAKPHEMERSRVTEQGFNEACLDEQALQELLSTGLTPVSGDPLLPQAFEKTLAKSIKYNDFIINNVKLNYLQPQEDVATGSQKNVVL